MTQIYGIYCGLCHRRYVANICKLSMPCKHECCEPLPDGQIRSSADLIECFAWRHSEVFKRFELQEIFFCFSEEKQTIKKYGMKFEASYVDEEELKASFLKFVADLPIWKWVVWVEAFRNLLFGGRSSNLIPNWRLRQLAKISLGENQ